MKNLIIGENSKIILRIKNNLINFDFISNIKIIKTNLNNYKYIYLFSWDFDSNKNNIKNINLIPNEKIVLISTTAVLALQEW